MSAIVRDNRATLSHIVDINLDPDEYVTTTGDRKKGTETRRPARVVGYHLRFEWSATYNRWQLAGWESAAYVQQARADDTWGEAQRRRVDRDDETALALTYTPDSCPEVTW